MCFKGNLEQVQSLQPKQIKRAKKPKGNVSNIYFAFKKCTFIQRERNLFHNEYSQKGCLEKMKHHDRPANSQKEARQVPLNKSEIIL